MKAGIFVNYRVGDCENEAAFLAHLLRERFGEEQVFFASRSIDAGDDFTQALPEGLERCSVLLALIGRDWLSVRDAGGRPRISLDEDWVRRELRTAIGLGMRIIPILVDGGTRLRMPDPADLPEDIREITRKQYVRMHYQRLNLDELLDRLARTNPELFARDVFTPPQALPADFAPSMLLRAEYGVVPFEGRRREEDDFDAWCGAGAPLAVRLLTGPGGQGKTRLARRWCERRSSEGWLAGMVDEEAEPRLLRKVLEVGAPVLLVFDYAEARVEQVRAAAQGLLGRERGGQPARLLLLTRAAGEWQRDLANDADDHLARVFEAAAEHRLAPLAGTPEGRRSEFTRAMAAFAHRLDRPPVAVPPSDLDSSRYERALDVHAAALSALLDLDVARPPGPESDPVRRVLAHERRYWRRSLGRHGLPARPGEEVDALVAAATLYGAPGHDDAVRLIGRLGPFRNMRASTLRDYLRWSAEIYPGSAALNPLRPDRLGEDHVAWALERRPELAAEALPEVSDTQLLRAVTVLGRAAPRHSAAVDAVRDLLIRDTERLLPLGMSVAPQLDEPRALAQTLVETVRDHPEPATVEKVLGLLPDQTNALADLAVLATEFTLDRARQRADINPRTTAYLLLRHAHHLRQVNRRREALEAAQQAESLFTGLAGQDPAAFLPELGRCAHTVGVLQSDLGAFAEGLASMGRAVTLRRRLASDDAYLPELALSLDVLSADFAEFGRWEESVAARGESVEAFRKLVRAHPGQYEPSLATALNNMSSLYGQLRRTAESAAAAAEAVELAQRLADEFPDKYLPLLASSLNHHAAALGVQGRAREALPLVRQAVDVRRKLVATGVDAARSDLASALNSQSIVEAGCGLRRESLASAEESVEIYRDLVAALPERYRPRLAMALTSLANRRDALGLLDEAVAAARETIGLRRELAEARPDAENPQLALALANCGAFLARQGRAAESVDTLQEAVLLYRSLAAAQPDVIEPALAGALHNLAAALHRLGGRPAEALAAVDEATALRRDLHRRLPGGSAVVLVQSLVLGARLRSASGAEGPVREALGEAERVAGEQADSRLLELVRKAVADCLG